MRADCATLQSLSRSISAFALALIAFGAPACTPRPRPAPAGWIILSEKAMIPTLNSLGRHLEEADKKFIQFQFQDTALALRMAARILRAESYRANEDQKKNLTRASENLNAVAGQLEAARQISRERLNSVIESAYRADIEHRWQSKQLTIFAPFIELPEKNIANAEDAISRKSFAEAAEQIRMAIGYMKVFAVGVKGEALTQLNRSTLELARLADLIDAASISRAADLHAAAARAHLALADVHIDIASESIAGNASTAVETHTVAAAKHALQGVQYDRQIMKLSE